MRRLTTWLLRFISRHATIETIALAVILLFPLLAPKDAVSLGFVALQYTLFALGLTIVVGWTGLLDLGAAGFVAVGAYTAAICMTNHGLPFLAVIPITLLTGVLAGVLLGIPTLRHRADYFAILTLGFAELVSLGIRNWPAVTRGSYGFSGIPATTLPLVEEPLRAFPPIGFYYLAAAIVIPAFIGIVRLRASRLGRHFHVVKHSENVAHAYGINVLVVKLAAFGLSAGLLAVGGLFWAAYQRSIVWTEFGVLFSCMLLSVLVVGGLGNPRGAVAGAFLVGSSLELLRRVLAATGMPPNIRFLLFAIALVLFVHLRPRGLLPDKPSWLSSDDGQNEGRNPKPRPRASNGNAHNSIGDRELVSISSVSKSFDGIVAIDHLSLHVFEGECVALIGPNGSGKTTLLNLVSGIVRPNAGEVRFQRKRIERWAPYRIARAGIGRSFQEVSVFDDISAEDNVYVTAGAVSSTEVLRSLDRFGILGRKDLAKDMSYGDKKKLDLARLFVDTTSFKMVLLDEPTAGLTQGEAQEIVATLSHLRQESGIAMIVVSHDVTFLDALNVDRVVVLRRGQILKEGAFDTIRDDPEVLRLFWGDETAAMA